MLDRFSKTLGAAEVYPGILVPKKRCSVDDIGTGSAVRIFFFQKAPYVSTTTRAYNCCVGLCLLGAMSLPSFIAWTNQAAFNNAFQHLLV
jgi:hypothetical protein